MTASFFDGVPTPLEWLQASIGREWHHFVIFVLDSLPIVFIASILADHDIKRDTLPCLNLVHILHLRVVARPSYLGIIVGLVEHVHVVITVILFIHLRIDLNVSRIKIAKGALKSTVLSANISVYVEGILWLQNLMDKAQTSVSNS